MKFRIILSIIFISQITNAQINTHKYLGTIILENNKPMSFSLDLIEKKELFQDTLSQIMELKMKLKVKSKVFISKKIKVFSFKKHKLFIQNQKPLLIASVI